MEKKKIIQKVVLGAVIINKSGKVLILQRSKDEDIYPNLWELPSGKKEPLESSLNSLSREIMEETGLQAEIIIPISVFDYKIEKTDEIRDTTQINFLVRTLEKEDVSLSHEHQNFAWIKRDQINLYDMTDSTKEAIRKALKANQDLGIKP